MGHQESRGERFAVHYQLPQRHLHLEPCTLHHICASKLANSSGCMRSCMPQPTSCCKMGRAKNPESCCLVCAVYNDSGSWRSGGGHSISSGWLSAGNCWRHRDQVCAMTPLLTIIAVLIVLQESLQEIQIYASIVLQFTLTPCRGSCEPS